MSDYVKIPTLKLKIKDVFSIKDLVKDLEEWLKENGYRDLEGGDDQESVYTHKLSQGGSWLDAWLWWRLVKYPQGTTEKTGYLRYLFNVDMHFLGDAKEVEVLHKGKKVKLNKGEVEVIISPIVELDFRNEWKKEGILGLVHNVFKKRIYKKEIDTHWYLLYKDAYNFQGVVKRFFKLEVVTPEEVVSQPPKGLI